MDLKCYTYVDRINIKEHDKFSDKDLLELKRIRILDKKLLSILKEVFIFLVFMVVLLEITFSNLSSSSMQYNYLFQSTFVDLQNQDEIGLNDVSYDLESLI